MGNQEVLRSEFMQWVTKQGVNSVIDAHSYSGIYRPTSEESDDKSLIDVTFLGGMYELSVRRNYESWRLGLDPRFPIRQYWQYSRMRPGARPDTPAHIDFGYSGPVNETLMPGSRAAELIMINTVDVLPQMLRLMTLLRSSQGTLVKKLS